jgi:hypothetical protein
MMTYEQPDAQTIVAKPERQSCGRYFFDCGELTTTTSDGVLCLKCGVTVTAQYFEQAYEGRSLS